MIIFQSSELEKERSSHAAELEKVRHRYEEAVAEAEERHQRSIEQFQERDQAWQNEKQVTLRIAKVHQADEAVVLTIHLTPLFPPFRDLGAVVCRAQVISITVA